MAAALLLVAQLVLVVLLVQGVLEVRLVHRVLLGLRLRVGQVGLVDLGVVGSTQRGMLGRMRWRIPLGKLVVGVEVAGRSMRVGI